MKTAQIKLFKVLSLSLVIGILTTVYCLLATKIHAQSSSRTFTISPPSIHITLKPGQKTEKTIKISNQSSETLEFVANTVDFVVTNKEGTPELIPAGTKIETPYAASTWSTVLPERIIVPAGKTIYTTVYVQVPGNARPGGRYFAVTLRPVNSGTTEGTGATVNSVVGSLVYLTVSGKISEKAQIVSFSTPKLSEYGPITLSTEIKNLSDIHIAPKATIEVKNIFGKKVFSAALANYNVFPGTSRIYENNWEEKWLFGPFKASLSGYYGQANNLPLVALATFWVIPYKLIAVILLAIAIGVVSFTYFKRKQEPEEVEE